MFFVCSENNGKKVKQHLILFVKCVEERKATAATGIFRIAIIIAFLLICRLGTSTQPTHKQPNFLCILILPTAISALICRQCVQPVQISTVAISTNIPFFRLFLLHLLYLFSISFFVFNFCWHLIFVGLQKPANLLKIVFLLTFLFISFSLFHTPIFFHHHHHFSHIQKLFFLLLYIHFVSFVTDNLHCIGRHWTVNPGKN